MKLEHFFFGIFALLLAATAMLAMHYRDELQFERRTNELIRQGHAVPKAPSVPAPAGAASAGTVESPAAVAAAASPDAEKARLQKQLQMAEEERGMLSEKMKKMQDNQAAGRPVDTAPLTDQQIKIKETPAIAKVKDYVADQGIAVLDAGRSIGLKTGQDYAVRRGHYIVAKKIEIGETIDENECAAIVEASSLQPGEVLKAGDEVIKWE